MRAVCNLKWPLFEYISFILIPFNDGHPTVKEILVVLIWRIFPQTRTVGNSKYRFVKSTLRNTASLFLNCLNRLWPYIADKNPENHDKHKYTILTSSAPTHLWCHVSCYNALIVDEFNIVCFYWGTRITFKAGVHSCSGFTESVYIHFCLQTNIEVYSYKLITQQW